MAHNGSFLKSRCLSTSVLLTTMWLVSEIANGKNSNAAVNNQYRLNVQHRSDDTYSSKLTEALPATTPAVTEIKDFNNSADLQEAATLNASNAMLKISERTWLLGWVVDVVKKAVAIVAESYVNEYQGNHTCHRNVCFTPESGLGLKVGGPKDPEEENTTFLFYDSNNTTGNEVNETTWESFLSTYTGNISKPLVAIVHGLNGSRHSPWALTLIDALLSSVGCNVLQVDWQERARFPHYAKAASSAPLVGVILSYMLQKMIEAANCSLHPNNVHIVGFSLGAHAAGVCGRHFYSTTGLQLGRITGLDPAGPLFVESNVSLTRTDAQFVDVIHTNAGELRDGRLGLNKSIGHVDFYPNGGSEQPNCSIAGDPACSHKRAQHLFIQSVYHNCSLESYYCKDGWSAFLSGECFNEKNASYVGDMGYYSCDAPGRGNQYLNTTGAPPYCYNHADQWKSLLHNLTADKFAEGGDNQNLLTSNQQT